MFITINELVLEKPIRINPEHISYYYETTDAKINGVKVEGPSCVIYVVNQIDPFLAANTAAEIEAMIRKADQALFN